MDQREKRVYLIQQLLNEKKEYRTIPIPDEEEETKSGLKVIFNVFLEKDERIYEQLLR